MGFTVIKDPYANLDYSIDWSRWLIGAETIATSAWTIALVFGPVTTPLAQHDAGLDISNKIATIWLSGGTVSAGPGLTSYDVTNSIVTNSVPPRSDQRTIRINIERR